MRLNDRETAGWHPGNGLGVKQNEAQAIAEEALEMASIVEDSLMGVLAVRQLVAEWVPG